RMVKPLQECRAARASGRVPCPRLCVGMAPAVFGQFYPAPPSGTLLARVPGAERIHMATAANRRPARVEMPAWGVGVFESRHASDFRMDLSRHVALEVVYVLGGAGTFELDGIPHPCRTGDVVVRPVDSGHRILAAP